MGNSIRDADIADVNPTNIYVSSFYMDTNLVSYSLWQTIYNYATNHSYAFDNAGLGKASSHPVQGVNWYDVVKWCNARLQLAGRTPCYYTDPTLTVVYTTGQVTNPYVNWAANGYRLPTEAEWEKAARGGLTGHRFPWGDTISESQANYSSLWSGGAPEYAFDLNTYSGYNTNFDTGPLPYTSPIGSFAANGYNLYDMAGNVWTWCWDWFGTPYGQPTANDPTGPASGSYRTLRGGSWDSTPDDNDGLRCAIRGSLLPMSTDIRLGLRCVRGTLLAWRPL